MSVYIDRKYLLLSSGSLRNFKQKKEDLFNFSCPFCGDSKKNKLKARGYVFRKNNDYFYICYNCQTSTTFSKFLKHVDAEAHKHYTLERYSNGENGKSNYQKPLFILDGPKPSEIFKNKIKLENINLKNIKQLPDGHIAREYILGRKIPEKYWNEIYFTDAFKDFLDSSFPDHGKDAPNDARIVLFYTDESGNVTNIAGRAINDSYIRYCTVKITNEKKLFGMHRLRKSDKIYAVEGQFDSFFIPNCIASGDSNLCGVAEHFSDLDVVLIFDREPRNREIVKQIEKAIDRGYTVCLLPDNLPGKDINDMVLGGVDDIIEIIEQHTYQGLVAKLKFTDWKKC